MHSAHLALLEICRVTRPTRPIPPLQVQLARRFADWFVNTAHREAPVEEQTSVVSDLITDISSKHALQYEDEGTLADRECSIAINTSVGFGSTAPSSIMWLDSLNENWLSSFSNMDPLKTMAVALGGFQLVVSVRTPPSITSGGGAQLHAWLETLPPCPATMQNTLSYACSHVFPWTQHARKRGPPKKNALYHHTSLLDRVVISPSHVQCRNTDTLLNVVSEEQSTALVACSNVVTEFDATWNSACALAQLSGASVDRPKRSEPRLMVQLVSPGLTFDPVRLSCMLGALANDYGLRLQQIATPDMRIGSQKRVCVMTSMREKVLKHDRATSAAACHPASAVFYGNFFMMPLVSEGSWAANVCHTVISVLPWITCYCPMVQQNELIL